MVGWFMAYVNFMNFHVSLSFFSCSQNDKCWGKWRPRAVSLFYWDNWLNITIKKVHKIHCNMETIVRHFRKMPERFPHLVVNIIFTLLRWIRHTFPMVILSKNFQQINIFFRVIYILKLSVGWWLHFGNIINLI